MGTMPDDRVQTWLMVARTHGDHLVHLTTRAAGGESLCGRPARALPPQRSFRHSGCQECLTTALRSGHLVAQEDKAWLNLHRMPRQDLTPGP